MNNQTTGDSASALPLPLDAERDRLLAAYQATRARTEALAASLSPEDQQLQSMPDASPTKWHRAHTTWFFEEFVLGPLGVSPIDRRYAFLFNSYYEAVGARHPRPKRGLLSRPTVAEISDYRRTVDERVARVIAATSADALRTALPMLELGINHEEQHQELLLTDILDAFAENPLRPAYLRAPPTATASGRAPSPLRFVREEGGLCSIGATDGGFAFDNERPRHKTWIEPFALADRLVTIAELTAFIDAGGYRTPSLWLSEGWEFVRTSSVTAPHHCVYEDGVVRLFTLVGERVASADEPVVHVSLYEADAIARFLGARLPTEGEWEIVASKQAQAAMTSANFLDDERFRPLPAGGGSDTPAPNQLFGDAWEWTRSSYDPYPGYQAPAGAVGEYNGKFMVSQLVLRGGSCLTPRRHMRAAYRNFWPARTRFQMAGIRLARGAA
jgi:ergothioneine biosynthesis protein EgtB